MGSKFTFKFKLGPDSTNYQRMEQEEEKVGAPETPRAILKRGSYTCFDFDQMRIIEEDLISSASVLNTLKEHSEYSNTVCEETPRSNDFNLRDYNSVRSILIVDDDPMNQEALKVVLANVVGNQYVISCENNGVSAVKSVMEQTPVLIFMDINLKGSVDGFQASEKIKEITNTPVIIAVSGDPIDRRKA